MLDLFKQYDTLFLCLITGSLILTALYFIKQQKYTAVENITFLALVSTFILFTTIPFGDGDPARALVGKELLIFFAFFVALGLLLLAICNVNIIDDSRDTRSYKFCLIVSFTGVGLISITEYSDTITPYLIA